MSNKMYDWLNDWCYNYDIPKGYIGAIFSNLHKLLGVTTFEWNENKENIAQIQIKDYLKNYPFACKSVCWHEFCHAEVWVKDGYTDGHSTAWVKRMLRKPWFIIGCIYAQLICIGK